MTMDLPLHGISEIQSAKRQQIKGLKSRFNLKLWELFHHLGGGDERTRGIRPNFVCRHPSIPLLTAARS